MKILRNYSLSITLAALFLISLIGQAYFQWLEFVQNQLDHGLSPSFTNYFPEFAAATLENWQSEFLQLFTFVVLAKYLIHKGSPQSRDGDDEMKKMLMDIKKSVSKGKGR